MGTTMDVAGDGFSIHVLGRPGPSGEPCLALMHQYIEGWYSTPDLKVESHARQTGDGNFRTPDDRVLYESRTVTAHVLAYGRNRDEVVEWAGRLHRAVGGTVTVTVTDGGVSTWVRGYCQLNFDAEHYEDAMPGTLTVVCDDPRRYGAARSAVLAPAGPSGGLVFHAGEPRGLVWPLSFGDGSPSAQRAVLVNEGTARAYPVLECAGVDAGFSVLDADGRGVTCASTGGWQPLVLDCLSRTATVAGVDRTRDLRRRDFFSVPPGGTLALSLHGTARGSVTCRWHDTYI